MNTTPTPKDGRDALPAEVGVDVLTRLRVLSCTVCGLAYAAPVSFHLAKSHAGEPVVCPAGHPNVYPDPSDPDARLSVLAANLCLHAEVATLRLQADRMRAELAALPKPDEKPCTDAELRARAGHLAGTALCVEYGRTVCQFCGKESRSRDALRRHLIKTHADDVKALPRGRFEP